MAPSDDQQFGKDFNFQLSLPAMTDDLRKLIIGQSDIKIGFGSSGPVRPDQIGQDNIMEEAREVAGIEDKEARVIAIRNLLALMTMLAKDAQRIGEWAVEADKSIEAFPKILRALTVPGVQLDRIKFVGQDSPDT